MPLGVILERKREVLETVSRRVRAAEIRHPTVLVETIHGSARRTGVAGFLSDSMCLFGRHIIAVFSDGMRMSSENREDENRERGE